MTTEEKLRSALEPCPFCGGDAASYEGRHCSSVKCDNGHAIHVYQPTLALAIAAWNRRAAPQPQPAQGEVGVPRKLASDVEAMLHRIAGGLEDEGGRVYLYSTEQADELREMAEKVTTAMHDVMYREGGHD